MKQLKRGSPANADRWVSLHDKRITKIVCEEDRVMFHFKDGFTVIEGNSANATKTGRLTLSGCDHDEFSCWIVRRKASRKGSKCYGKPVSLRELGELLSEKGKAIEIYLELYDANFLHWRGALCPYNKRDLSDLVVIETMDFFPMTYEWE